MTFWLSCGFLTIVVVVVVVSGNVYVYEHNANGHNFRQQTAKIDDDDDDDGLRVLCIFSTHPHTDALFTCVEIEYLWDHDFCGCYVKIIITPRKQ